MLQLGDALLQEVSGSGVSLALLLEIVVNISFRDCVYDLRCHFGIGVREANVDQSCLFIYTARFFNRLYLETSKNCSHVGRQAFGFS